MMDKLLMTVVRVGQYYDTLKCLLKNHEMGKVNDDSASSSVHSKNCITTMIFQYKDGLETTY